MEPIKEFRGSNRFLSNFFVLKTPVFYEGLVFFTVENAYVAAKTTNNTNRIFIQTLTAAMAKMYGERILTEGLFPNLDWNDEFRLKLMKDLVSQKFSKNAELKEMLLQTGEAELIEGNYWHDNFFGICSCGNCPKEKKYEGPQNNLGKILMEVRKKLKEG